MKKIRNKLLNIFLSKLFIGLLVFLSLAELNIFMSIDDVFHLYFLDVGQGDAILIRTPDFKYILVDAGEYDVIVEELAEVLPFWVKRIDMLIGTHGDRDHIGGFPSVLENYAVGRLYFSRISEGNEIQESILALAEENSIEVAMLGEGDLIKTGDLSLEVLWPEEDFIAENENQNSIVIHGKYGQFSFLLTGDIEKEQELKIAQENDLTIDLLKAAHHGSKTASSDQFLVQTMPDLAVISCGADNKFGHPAEEVINRLEGKGIRIIRTDLSGRIEFITIKSGIYYRLEKYSDGV